jgi:hypothetical protein
VIARLGWRSAVVCLSLAVLGGLATWDVRVAGGVVGGGALTGLALWALTGIADALTGAAGSAKTTENRPVSRGFALVKFFTRHAILAFVAYVMMARLHLDPVGMIVGVTSVVVAAALEAMRPR